MNSSYLNIMQCNSRSIKDKSKQIAILEEAQKNNIDIISLNETWLKEKDHITFNNFDCYRKDRTKKKGCGVALMCHKSIKSIKISIPIEFGNAEVIGIELSANTTFTMFASRQNFNLAANFKKCC